MKGKTRINFWCHNSTLKDFDKVAKEARRDRTFMLNEAMHLYISLSNGGGPVADLIMENLKRQNLGIR